MSERPSLTGIVRDFLADRPIMKEKNTPQHILWMLAGEMIEATQAIESGDEMAIRDEIADLVFLSISLAIQLDVDPEEVTREKAALNHLKLPASMFKEGDYDEQYLKSRMLKKKYRITEEFYEDG